MEYKEYSYNEPTKDLPLKIFEAPPPYGKRIVTINIETEGSDKASVIFAGRIYEYRDRFQAKEIPGGFPGSGEGEEKGKYCRLLKSVDVSEEAEVEKVWVVVIGLLLRLKRLEMLQKQTIFILPGHGRPGRFRDEARRVQGDSGRQPSGGFASGGGPDPNR